MQIDNQFTIPQAPDDVFALLLDVERVAPCLPGAQLLDKEGDVYTGSIRVKVGPLVAAYEGTATISEVDESGRRAVLNAAGSEVGGQGGADARVQLEVHEVDGSSDVRIHTDLEIRGRAAQFGRGVMGDVASRIVEQFATNLEAALRTGNGDGGRSGRVGTGPADGKPATSGTDPFDLLEAGLEPVLRRVMPYVLAGAIGFIIGRWFGRNTSSSPSPVHVIPAGQSPTGTPS